MKASDLNEVGYYWYAEHGWTVVHVKIQQEPQQVTVEFIGIDDVLVVGSDEFDGEFFGPIKPSREFKKQQRLNRLHRVHRIV